MKAETALGVMVAGMMLALVPAIIVWQYADHGWAIVVWVACLFAFCFVAFRQAER